MSNVTHLPPRSKPRVRTGGEAEKEAVAICEKLIRDQVTWLCDVRDVEDVVFFLEIIIKQVRSEEER